MVGFDNMWFIFQLKGLQDLSCNLIKETINANRDIFLCLQASRFYTLRKKVQLGTLFVPYLEPSGKRVPTEKGPYLHVQESKKVPYITKNGSKEPKMVLKMVLKTHLEPFREPLKVPPVGQQRTLLCRNSFLKFCVANRGPVVFSNRGLLDGLPGAEV